MYPNLEYANFTILAFQQLCQEYLPSLTSSLVMLSILQEYVLIVWCLIIEHFVNIIISCLVYVATNYGVYWKYFCSDRRVANDPAGDIWSDHDIEGRAARVLFVTAHPDDECMFFGPTIISLVKSKAEVYLVCLSAGNLYGLGAERKHELWAACETLGIDSSCIWLYKHDRLKDDPAVEWRAGLVASIILRTVETLDIDTIITFDKRGVSGHKNHISIYRAMALLKARNLLATNCRVYLLESVSLLRKYLFYADLLLSMLLPKSCLFVSTIQDRNTLVSAMGKHSSQYVWYRKLFMIFSRYTYVNTLSNFIG